MYRYSAAYRLSQILMLQMLADTQAGYRLWNAWAWSVSQPELTNDS